MPVMTLGVSGPTISPLYGGSCFLKPARSSAISSSDRSGRTLRTMSMAWSRNMPWNSTLAWPRLE